MTNVIERIGREAIPADIRTRPRRDAILLLSKHTTDTNVIAAIMGISKNSVASTLSQLRRAGHDIPTRNASGTLNVGIEVRCVVPRVLMTRLRPAATRRDMSPAELAKKLLIMVLADDMVDAILDD